MCTPLNALTASSFFLAQQIGITRVINVFSFSWISLNSFSPPKTRQWLFSSLCSVASSTEPNMKIRFPVTTRFASRRRREQESLEIVTGKTWKRRTGWQPGMTKITILNSQWDPCFEKFQNSFFPPTHGLKILHFFLFCKSKYLIKHSASEAVLILDKIRMNCWRDVVVRGCPAQLHANLSVLFVHQVASALIAVSVW